MKSELDTDFLTFQTGAVIVNIIPGSLAEKDKRLQVFDQIIEINALKMTPELSSELLQRAVKQVQSKVSKSVGFRHVVQDTFFKLTRASVSMSIFEI